MREALEAIISWIIDHATWDFVMRVKWKAIVSGATSAVLAAAEWFARRTWPETLTVGIVSFLGLLSILELFQRGRWLPITWKVAESPVLHPPGAMPTLVQGWQYYALQLCNEQWRSPKNFYGIRAELAFKSPEGICSVVRGLFRDRRIGSDVPPLGFLKEIVKLEPDQQGVELTLAISSGGSPRRDDEELEKLWTCSSYPPNITLETPITLGEWCCEIKLSWQGGATTSPYRLTVRRQMHLQIEPLPPPPRLSSRRGRR